MKCGTQHGSFVFVVVVVVVVRWAMGPGPHSFMVDLVEWGSHDALAWAVESGVAAHLDHDKVRLVGAQRCSSSLGWRLAEVGGGWRRLGGGWRRSAEVGWRLALRDAAELVSWLDRLQGWQAAGVCTGGRKALEWRIAAMDEVPQEDG